MDTCNTLGLSNDATTFIDGWIDNRGGCASQNALIYSPAELDHLEAATGEPRNKIMDYFTSKRLYFLFVLSGGLSFKSKATIECWIDENDWSIDETPDYNYLQSETSAPIKQIREFFETMKKNLRNPNMNPKKKTLTGKQGEPLEAYALNNPRGLAPNNETIAELATASGLPSPTVEQWFFTLKSRLKKKFSWNPAAASLPPNRTSNNDDDVERVASPSLVVANRPPCARDNSPRDIPSLPSKSNTAVAATNAACAVSSTDPAFAGVPTSTTHAVATAVHAGETTSIGLDSRLSRFQLLALTCECRLLELELERRDDQSCSCRSCTAVSRHVCWR